MSNTIDTNDNDRLKITAKCPHMLANLVYACGIYIEDMQKHVTQSPDGMYCVDMHAEYVDEVDVPYYYFEVGPASATSATVQAQPHSQEMTHA